VVKLGCNTFIQAENMLVLSQMLQVDYCIQNRKAECLAANFKKEWEEREETLKYKHAIAYPKGEYCLAEPELSGRGLSCSLYCSA
jgi:hypothetical protein